MLCYLMFCYEFSYFLQFGHNLTVTVTLTGKTEGLHA